MPPFSFVSFGIDHTHCEDCSRRENNVRGIIVVKLTAFILFSHQRATHHAKKLRTASVWYDMYIVMYCL